MEQQVEYVFGLTDTQRADIARHERLLASLESIVRKPFDSSMVCSLETALGEEYRKLIPPLRALDPRTATVSLENSLLQSRLGFAAIIAAVVAAIFALFGKMSDTQKEKPDRLTKAIEKLEKNKSEFTQSKDQVVEAAPKDSNSLELVLNSNAGIAFGDAVRKLLNKPELTNMEAWAIYKKSDNHLIDSLPIEFFSPAAIKLVEEREITEAMLHLGAVFSSINKYTPLLIKQAEGIITDEQVWARAPEIGGSLNVLHPKSLYNDYFRRSEPFWHSFNPKLTQDNYREGFKEFLDTLKRQYQSVPIDENFRKRIEVLLHKPHGAAHYAKELETTLTEFLKTFAHEESRLSTLNIQAAEALDKAAKTAREGNMAVGRQVMSDQEFLTSNYYKLLNGVKGVFRWIAESVGQVLSIGGVVLSFITKISKLLEHYTKGLEHVIVTVTALLDAMQKAETK